jgi:hypothetical protein
LLRLRAVRNVSAPGHLLTYLAAEVPKTSDSFAPWRWTDVSATRPARSEEAREGVALALHLFELGSAREMRVRFARELARQQSVSESWFRSLALEIRR